MATQANHFELQSSDGSTKVTYSTTSLTGAQILTLTQAGGPPRTFIGAQVRALNTEIGSLVTVTTLLTIDAGSTSFSVLIPVITIDASNPHPRFKTEAIVTRHSGPLSVASHGVHETYTFIPLNGEASFIVS